MSHAEAAMPPIAGRLVRPNFARPRRLTGEGGVSLLVHLLVLAALIVVLPRRQTPKPYAPTDVAVVFDGGPKAAAPQTQDGRKSAPSVAPNPNATEPVTPAPSSAAAAARSAPPEPAVAQPSASSPPAAAAPEVARGPSAVPLPMPSPEVKTQPRQAPRRPALSHRAAALPAEGALSMPMTFSLGGAAPPPASVGHLKRGITLSMAPTEQNRNVMTRYAEARRELGEDWWAAFSRFVEEHKYYPEEAAKNDEDGQVVLHLVIERDGSVRSAKLELSSGSPQLDMAWLSEFRGARVPPFPAGTNQNEVSFSASMTYILQHL